MTKNDKRWNFSVKNWTLQHLRGMGPVKLKRNWQVLLLVKMSNIWVYPKVPWRYFTLSQFTPTPTPTTSLKRIHVYRWENMSSCVQGCQGISQFSTIPKFSSSAIFFRYFFATWLKYLKNELYWLMTFFHFFNWQ